MSQILYPEDNSRVFKGNSTLCTNYKVICKEGSMKSICRSLSLTACATLLLPNVLVAGDSPEGYSSKTEPIEVITPQFGPFQDFLTWPWTERNQYLWYAKNQNWDERLGYTAHYYQADPDAHKDCIRNGLGAGWFMSHNRCQGSIGSLKKREISRAFPDYPSCDTRFVFVTANYCDW